MQFTFIDLFAGIGGFHQAATPLGGKCVFACEIDPHAQKVYAENYGIIPYGDITTIDAHNIPDHDVLFAGFPCQAFSICGDMKGFEDTRGTLFFEIARILKAKKPPIFVLENVKQLSTHDNGQTLKAILKTLEEIGYNTCWKVLNALDFGLPQKRERTIIVGFLSRNVAFTFPEPRGRYDLSAILEPDSEIDSKFFASEHIKKRRLSMHKPKHTPSIWHENKAGNISSYPYSCALRAGASYNYLLVNGVRRPTHRELLRLQGFPDNFKIVVSDSQTRKQAGNAVPVNVIRAVLEEVLNAWRDQGCETTVDVTHLSYIQLGSYQMTLF
jgi:DNA (cytosine-5)-methyltransferase 1